jgi:hypothetical protein
MDKILLSKPADRFWSPYVLPYSGYWKLLHGRKATGDRGMMLTSRLQLVLR